LTDLPVLSRYRAAFEDARDAIMFIDGDLQHYIEGNAATLAMFRVQSGEYFKTLHPADLSPAFQPDHRPSTPAAQAYIHEANRRGQAFFEWQHRTLDGEEFPTEVLISRVDQADHPFFQVIIRDISDRKRVEFLLRERVKELSALRDIIMLTTDDQAPLPGLLQAVADRLQGAWEAPNDSAVCIQAEGLTARSTPFRDRPRRYRASVEDGNGGVEISVYAGRVAADEWTAAQEQELLDSVAQQLHNALLRRDAVHKLRAMALRDPLTGITNRGGIQQRIERAREEHERYGTPFSVIMFDIDHFKRINDRFGHPAGDAVLQTLTRRIDGALRETDAQGRWGGEEFLVHTAQTEEQGAGEVAERLRRIIADDPFEGVGRVTISLGVAVHQRGESVEALEARVDDALYRAKDNGRNQVAIARPADAHAPD
jgi:diguanylate cyclase (GGDEF)-like protein/PAS domain S-box-containing protein